MNRVVDVFRFSSSSLVLSGGVEARGGVEGGGGGGCFKRLGREN